MTTWGFVDVVIDCVSSASYLSTTYPPTYLDGVLTILFVHTVLWSPPLVDANLSCNCDFRKVASELS